MRLLCKHKIGAHSATSSHEYPVIRLPREFKSLVGGTASIYQTEHKGKLAFIVTVDKSVGKFCANIGRSPLEGRLSALEKEIDELKSLFLSKESFKHLRTEINGLGRIRTGDLRHVKATS